MDKHDLKIGFYFIAAVLVGLGAFIAYMQLGPLGLFITELLGVLDMFLVCLYVVLLDNGIFSREGDENFDMEKKMEAVVAYCNKKGISYGQYQTMEYLGYLVCRGTGMRKDPYEIFEIDPDSIKKHLEQIEED